MKKLLMGLAAAMVLSIAVQAPALADGYNPFKDAYEAASYRERTPGQAQFVYVLVDENRAPLAGAVLRYVDRNGYQHSTTAGADGIVRLSFSQQRAYVQVQGVEADGRYLNAVGDDLVSKADYEDIREGDVDYYVLQRNAGRGVVYVYEAD